MRILYITHQYFPRHIGGTEILVRGLVAHMLALGNEPVVLTFVEAQKRLDADTWFNITEFEGAPLWELHHSLGLAEHPARAEFDNPALAELVARAAAELKPDVVHAVHVMKFSAALLPRLKSAGFPVVATLCDFWALCMRHTFLKPEGTICETGPDHAYRCLHCAQATHGFAKPAKPWSGEEELVKLATEAAQESAYPDTSFRRDVLALADRRDSLQAAFLSCDRILALSNFQRSVFVQHGYPSDRIDVVPHGMDTRNLAGVRERRQQEALANPAGRKRVVFMGTLTEHKGVHVLLEAMRTIPEVDLQLDIYGGHGVDASYVDRLNHLASSDARISFKGTVPPEQLGEVLCGAAALALPALLFGTTVAKTALYCGVPVAVSDSGALAELVDHTDLGWLLPAGEVSAWAEWLKSVAQTPLRVVDRPPSIPTARDFAGQMLAVYESVKKATFHKDAGGKSARGVFSRIETYLGNLWRSKRSGPTGRLKEHHPSSQS